MEGMRDVVNKIRWRFASTYAAAPHEYTVFAWYRDKPIILEQLLLFAHRIEGKGIRKKFGNEEFRYFVLDEFKYWIMDAANKCTLINRTFADDLRCQEIADALVRGQVEVHDGDCLLNIASKVNSNTKRVTLDKSDFL